MTSLVRLFVIASIFISLSLSKERFTFEKQNGRVQVGSSFKGGITQKALTYAIDQISVTLKKNLSALVYDVEKPIYQEISTPVGDVKLNISNLEISGINWNSFGVNLIQNQKMKISLSKGGGKAAYNWWFKLKNSEASGDGKAEVNLDFNLDFGLTIDAAKKWTAKAENTQVVMNKFDIDLGSKCPLWLKAILSVLKSTISKQVKEQIEKLLPDFINKNLTEMLNGDALAPISKKDDLSFYWYLNEAVFSKDSSYFAIGDVGEFVNENFQRFDTIEKPHDFPIWPQENKMVQGTMDEFFHNAAMYAMHNAKMIALALNLTKIKPEHRAEWAPFFNSSLFKDIVQPVYTKYPNKNLAYHIKSNSAPVMRIVNGVVAYHADMNVDVNVITSPSTVATVFRFNFVIESPISLSILAQSIGFKFTTFTFSSKLIESLVGPFDYSAYSQWLALFMKNIAIPYINEKGAEGIKIPYLDDFGIKMINQKLDLLSGFGKFVTDLQIDPKVFTEKILTFFYDHIF